MPGKSPPWDQWSKDRIRHEQSRRLRRFLLDQLVPFSPHYRNLFKAHGIDPRSIRSVEDLERVPFTTKADIAPDEARPDRPRDLILQPDAATIRASWGLRKKIPLLAKKLFRGGQAVLDELAMEYRPVSVFFTTGRSALPTAFTLSRYDLALLEEVGRRILIYTGVDPQVDRLINIFPYAPHLAFWQVYSVGVGGAVFTLNTGGGKVMGTSGIIQAIQKIRPAYLAGIPGYIYHLLREAHSAAVDMSFVKGLALGGDQVTPAYRRRVREMLVNMGATKPKVISVFGFTEARKCWAECPGEARGGFHTYPDLEVMEIVDPETGKPVPEGETGELVYTCLDGRASCVLRYRTGDLVIGGMTWEPCPECGRTVPRIGSQLERVSNLKSFQLSKVKGTLVNLNVFKQILESDDRIEEWQLVIRKRNDDPYDVDEMLLNVAVSSDVAGDARELRDEIERRLFEATEVKLNSIQVLPLAKVLELLGMETQLKEKRIVDLRKREPAETDRTTIASEKGTGAVSSSKS